MRRCYKCGAKMQTDYIVCEDCEREIEGRRGMNFDADKYWKKHEKDCPYAEGNKCFIVNEPSDESCKGCRWYEYSKNMVGRSRNDESKSIGSIKDIRYVGR